MKWVPVASSHNGSGRVWLDGLGPTRDRKVVGSNPIWGTAGPPYVDTEPDQFIAGGGGDLAGHQRERPRPGTLCR